MEAKEKFQGSTNALKSRRKSFICVLWTKNDNPLDIITTCVIAVTNKRLVIGQKRVVFGYFYYSITPDLYNDLQVRNGLIWGDVIIDTVKEKVHLSNIDPKGLIEIETVITEFMMKEKKKYHINENQNNLN